MSPTRSTARRAWITGGSVGIGAAFARRLARDGYDLTLVARNRKQLTQLAGELHGAHGVRVDAMPADLTDAAALGEVERALADDRHLDLLSTTLGSAPTAFSSPDGTARRTRSPERRR
jgi:short-subunit dehydrogenase